MKAIEVKDATAQVDLDRCIGCGLCVTGCSTGAVRMELKPEGEVVIIFNVDKPGVLGRYGTVFGNNRINIADMTFSRKMKKGLAVVGINLDQDTTEKVTDEIRGPMR